MQHFFTFAKAKKESAQMKINPKCDFIFFTLIKYWGFSSYSLLFAFSF